MKKILCALAAALVMVLAMAVLLPQAAQATSDTVSFVGRGEVVEQVPVASGTTEVRIERTEGMGTLRAVDAPGFDWDELATGAIKVVLVRPNGGEDVSVELTVRNPKTAIAKTAYRVRTKGSGGQLPTIGGGLQTTIAWGPAPPVNGAILGFQISRKVAGDLGFETDLFLGGEGDSEAETIGVGPWSSNKGFSGGFTVGPAWRPQDGVHVWARAGLSIDHRGKLGSRPVLIDLGMFAPLDPFDGVFEWGGRALGQIGSPTNVGLEVKGFYSILQHGEFALLAGMKVEEKFADKTKFFTIIPELQPTFRTKNGTFRIELGYGFDSGTGQPAARAGLSFLPY